MALYSEVHKLYAEKAKERGETTSLTITKPQDVVTPYKICVLTFLREYMETRDSSEFQDPEDRIEYTEPEKTEVMRVIVHLLKTPDMSLAELRQLLSARVNSQLVGRFESTLLGVYRGGAGQLSDLFDKLWQPITEGSGGMIYGQFSKLNKFSVVGLFIRQMLVSFKLMSLEDILKYVVSEFNQYCKESLSSQDNSQSLDISSATSSTKLAKVFKPSRWQAERRLAQLTTLIEDNEKKAGSPVEVADELNCLLRSYPSLYQAYYVHYLNCMRINEYSGARGNLHQFYDQMMLSSCQGSTVTESINKGSRYASLSLASLQARFGHIGKAMYSVKEAVRLAQEANDKTCLRHALLWLQHLDQSSQVDDIHDLSTMLNKTSFVPDVSVPASFIKTLKAPDLTNPPRMMLEEVANVKASPSRGQQKLCNTIALAQKTLSAAIWSHYSYRTMASMIAQAVLTRTSQSKEHQTEHDCLALCTLSDYHFSLANYESAQITLSVAKNCFPKPYHDSINWLLTEQCQLFSRSYYHCDVNNMALACDNLLPLDRAESTIKRACLYRCKGLYQQSRLLLDQMLNDTLLKKATLHNSRLCVRVRLELIELLCQTGDYEVAARYILDAIKLSTVLHLNYERALCNFYAAYIQLMKGFCAEALKIMTENFAMLLICGDKFTIARAQLFYSRCRVAASKDDINRMACLHDCVEMVEKARDGFEVCEAHQYLEESLIFLALLCHNARLVEKRNLYAFKHKQFQKDHYGGSSPVKRSPFLL